MLIASLFVFKIKHVCFVKVEAFASIFWLNTLKGSKVKAAKDYGKKSLPKSSK